MSKTLSVISIIVMSCAFAWLYVSDFRVVHIAGIILIIWANNIMMESQRIKREGKA